MLPAASRALLKPRDFCGQMETQRIQEMHFFTSVSDGRSGGIAPTGHFFAQIPQPVQDFFVLGFIGTPPYSRYGRFPGIQRCFGKSSPQSPCERSSQNGQALPDLSRPAVRAQTAGAGTLPLPKPRNQIAKIFSGWYNFKEILQWNGEKL